MSLAVILPLSRMHYLAFGYGKPLVHIPYYCVYAYSIDASHFHLPPRRSVNGDDPTDVTLVAPPVRAKTSLKTLSHHSNIPNALSRIPAAGIL